MQTLHAISNELLKSQQRLRRAWSRFPVLEGRRGTPLRAGAAGDIIRKALGVQLEVAEHLKSFHGYGLGCGNSKAESNAW